MIEKDTGVDLPGHEEQRDSLVVVAELVVTLHLLDVDDFGVFEILRAMFLTLYRLPGVDDVYVQEHPWQEIGPCPSIGTSGSPRGIRVGNWKVG
ncbi:unnamed protein product [Schistocephalus solidus]|uniref:Uncharacterized protein n=1 Tax=Schistocephalus solidus TaxID=70667 RepID=A0A183SPY5_SCHSO|nr:unnamed protein product [Schistocephalus solidus]